MWVDIHPPWVIAKRRSQKSISGSYLINQSRNFIKCLFPYLYLPLHPPVSNVPFGGIQKVHESQQATIEYLEGLPFDHTNSRCHHLHLSGSPITGDFWAFTLLRLPMGTWQPSVSIENSNLTFWFSGCVHLRLQLSLRAMHKPEGRFCTRISELGGGIIGVEQFQPKWVMHCTMAMCWESSPRHTVFWVDREERAELTRLALSIF